MEERGEEDFDRSSNILGALLPKPMKRLMREIQECNCTERTEKPIKTASGNLLVGS
jgi:hypothetical protein